MAESDGVVAVCARVDVESEGANCYIDHAFNVSFSTRDGTAGMIMYICFCQKLSLYIPLISLIVSPDDYEELDTHMTFEPRQTMQCVAVDIKNDCEMERDVEMFRAELGRSSNTDGRIMVDPGPLTVNITDSDGESCKHLHTHTHTLSLSLSLSCPHTHTHTLLWSGAQIHTFGSENSVIFTSIPQS